MSLHRWVILIGGLGLVFILFTLPKVVVDNDAIETEIADSQAEAVDESHGFSFSAKDVERRSSLLKLLETSSGQEKSVIFADSLARLYLSYNMLDSAGYFADEILKQDSSWLGQLKAGEIYFQLFGISLSQSDLARYSHKAGECFRRVLAREYSPDLEAKLGMTMVVSDNPMQGITVLRGILEEYPENITALYSLGLLSIQSGQYEKAIGRFEKLMTIDPTNQQAAFLLATSYFETSQYDEAGRWFENIKSTSTDPAILSSTDQYLKKLNEL
ncbi:hypothetical protein BFP72_17975 [Reichenbachiella sp. 5M10]|uniref:tetratricopeptide repeat protein n=1 Tax=Reichenbachiella sp. 5M10 TaxID=1889772 RepID=UPI000C147DE4|nr:tetratricopeptide repeat protein [Reichenbachiella sp. 5M10]PIB37160.1 hypothetical protein BFP72_17975 [Reichenbachiella sp. 5M10]